MNPRQTEPSPSPKMLLLGLTIGLVAWGIYHALGAWLGGLGGILANDWRRGAVVLAFVLAFVAVLWWAMHARQRTQNLPRESPPDR